MDSGAYPVALHFGVDHAAYRETQALSEFRRYTLLADPRLSYPRG